MALSFGKKRAPSEALMQKHRDQLRIHTQWRDDLARIRAISGKLDSAYSEHKGDFALGRYEGLKQMIKDAIKDYKDLMQKSQKYALDSAAGAIASKYGGGQQAGQGQSRQTNKGQGQAEAQKEGFMARLKRQAAAFTGSGSSDEVKESAKEPTTATTTDLGNWGYEGMTAKQVEEELDSMRKEVLQFKQEFRRERDKLDRLSKEYEDSKKLSPPQRYTELKYMIKDATNTK